MRNTTSAVLVTGASGFIGRQTVERLTSDGWHVIPAGRNIIENKGLILDFESPDFLYQLHNLPKVSAIVHLAAKVELKQETYTDLYAANIGATAALLLKARQWNAFFVFASSALVAGTNTPYINMFSPDAPDNAYARTKWLSEQLVRASGVRHSILRIGGVYGLYGPEHLGINRSINTVVNGKPPKQIGCGNAKRNYIYVRDVAIAISDVLKRQLEGTHLLAGCELLSISQMLQLMCNVFLPGCNPEKILGSEASDQIIEVSESMIKSSGFLDALKDMQRTVL